MKRYSIAVAVLITVTVVTGIGIMVTRPQSTEAAAAPVPEWLLKAAEGAAAQYGDAAPETLSWALTTTGAAKAVELGESRPVESDVADTPCYVAVITGDFTVRGGRGLGESEMSGDAIELVYDPDTHERTDMVLFEGQGILDTSAIPSLQIVVGDSAASTTE